MAKKLEDTAKFKMILESVKQYGSYITSAHVFIAKNESKLKALGFDVEYCPATTGPYPQKACYMISRQTQKSNVE